MSFLTLAPHLLCPPGEGVFTVNTGKDKREKLQQALYQNANPREAWLASLKKIDSFGVALLGVASDNGGGIQRGANWGPLFIREAMLNDGTLLADLGDVRVIPHLLHDKYLNTETINACRQGLYGDTANQWPVSPLSITEEILDQLYHDHKSVKVLALGGDHSVSYPLVRSWAKARRNKKMALLHFDAHTDLLDKRLGIDLCFGSWTYHVREFFPSKDHLIQVGIRSTGKDRGHWESLGLTQLWAKEILTQSAHQVAEQIIAQYQRAGIEEVYISFDIDVLDQKWASATGTPETGGLDPVFCGDVIRLVADKFKVTGADLVEVAPMVNHNFFPNNSQETSLMTAASVARFLARAMGADA